MFLHSRKSSRCLNGSIKMNLFIARLFRRSAPSTSRLRNLSVSSAVTSRSTNRQKQWSISRNTLDFTRSTAGHGKCALLAPLAFSELPPQVSLPFYGTMSVRVTKGPMKLLTLFRALRIGESFSPVLTSMDSDDDYFGQWHNLCDPQTG